MVIQTLVSAALALSIAPGAPRTISPLCVSGRANSPLCVIGSAYGVDDLQKTVRVLKPLGLTLEQFDEDATDSGVIVRAVAPGSSCERAGVEPGWSLEAVDDVDVSRSSVAVVVAEIAAADDQLRLRFRSNRDSFTFGNFGFGSNAFG